MGNLTYGEVTSVGINKLIGYIKPLLKENSIFLDIGSGYGKIPVCIAENLNIPSYGIEISKEKTKIAKTITWTNKKDKVFLSEGNILENINLLKKVDIIFINNICWSNTLTDFVLDHSNAHVFMIKKSKKYADYQEFKINVSWSKNECPIYKLNTNTNR
jgi:precorrin-6B methylase 2